MAKVVFSKNDYKFGEDTRLDELRANVNISKVLAGKVKRKFPLVRKN